MRRRMLAVLATLGLVATAVFGVAPAASANGGTPPGGATYVALGDSEAAGTGNQPYVLGAPCYRSKKSYPLLAGGVSYACAGATILDAAYQAQNAFYAGDLGPDTQKVTIQVGINDLRFTVPGSPDPVGWQQLLAYCFAAGDVACNAALSTVSGNLGALTDLLAGIRTIVGSDAQIDVIGYPKLFGSFSGTCAIGTYERTAVVVTSAQAAIVNNAIARFNLSLNVLTYTIYGVQLADFVGLNNVFGSGLFDGHGLCDSGESWISGLMPETSRNWVRSLHINSPGQKAIAGLIG